MASSTQDIWNRICSNAEIKKMARAMVLKGDSDLWKDVVQEAYVVCLEKGFDLEKAEREGKLLGLFSTIIFQTANSNSTKKRYYPTGSVEMVYEPVDPDWDVDPIEQEVNANVQRWIDDDSYDSRHIVYMKRLWRGYVREGSIRNLAVASGIPRMTICSDLLRFKKIVKDKQNEYRTYLLTGAHTEWYRISQAFDSLWPSARGQQPSSY